MAEEWVKAADQLPAEGDEEASDDALVLMDEGTMTVAYVDFVARKWMDRWGEPVTGVEYWKSLPDPPVN